MSEVMNNGCSSRAERPREGLREGPRLRPEQRAVAADRAKSTARCRSVHDWRWRASPDATMRPTTFK